MFRPHSRRSRNKIRGIAPRPAYRLLPTASRDRGLASIGFELQPPSEIDLEAVESGDTVVRCSERRADGKMVGELEVAVFRAALVIDRDGILEQKVRVAAEVAGEPCDGGSRRDARVRSAVPVMLPGASGYRADVELVRPMGVARPPLPYRYVFAIASHDLGVEGGVLVTVRCATPDWPAADALLRSLRILGRRGATANDVDEAAPMLPMIGRRDDDGR